MFASVVGLFSINVEEVEGVELNIESMRWGPGWGPVLEYENIPGLE